MGVKLRQANPDMKATDVMREVGNLWKVETNKIKYEKAAAADKERYKVGLALALIRVARWCIFLPKNHNLGKFLWALEWKMLAYILYCHLDFFIAIRFILWLLNTFCGNLVFLPGLVRCTYKNWQPWL
jgi:hypothetical protein